MSKNLEKNITDLYKIFQRGIEQEVITNNVRTLYNKIKIWSEKYGELFVKNEKGRDFLAYFPYSWAYFYVLSNDRYVGNVLRKWDIANTSPGYTAGMLMDYALAWKHAELDFDEYRNTYAERRTVERKKINRGKKDEQYFEKKKEKSARFLTKEHVDANKKHDLFGIDTRLGKLRSDEGYEINAGPSSSTATLLWFLRRVNDDFNNKRKITKLEAICVTYALTKMFWPQGIKKFMGQFHTDFEAIIPLERHIRKFPGSYSDIDLGTIPQKARL
ncbi:hypothetical protein [Azospirillum sp. B4]|uniref:hypothetical protein n=1 Tax=Azospirillum sp. B4 TaxID=95605 RepID=UPI0011DD2AE0|nr:hypothetical protein [Azospirillum sp. B4]